VMSIYRQDYKSQIQTQGRRSVNAAAVARLAKLTVEAAKHIRAPAPFQES
jgi:hypothetical protein